MDTVEMENQLNEAIKLIKEFVTLGGAYGGFSRRAGKGLNTVEAIYDPYHSWGGFYGIYQAYGRRHVFIRDNGHLLYIEPNSPLDLDSPNTPQQALEWVRQMISSALAEE